MDDATKKGFSGVVLVGDLQNVLYEHAFGLADKERKLPHQVNEIWRWASVTKQVTAALVMQQVDRQHLFLDSPVQAYLPMFPKVVDSPITVRNLLQHTSGLPNPDDAAPGAENEVPVFYRVSPARTTRQRLSFCMGTSKRKPGERFEYNNCDYIILGALLTKISGMPYKRLLQKELNSTLGTSLRLATKTGSKESKVKGYLDKGQPEPTIQLSAFGASGALVGTPRDLLALDRALLTNRLVSKPSTETMWKGEPKLGYAALGAWSFEVPLKNCTGDVALVERRGEIGGIQVRNILAPKLGRAVIVFTNSSAVEFGEIWQGSGFSYDVLSAALCSKAP